MALNYAELLEHSFAVEKEQSDCESRLEFLSDHIFDFTTYDSAMAELFARKAVEVCAAITNHTTFDYIKNQDDYEWFLIMCNMPFFATRIDWGSSIRGAWWSSPKQFELASCGLWIGSEQKADALWFTNDEWTQFIRAVVAFAETSLAPA
jgi:hypothetical protein